MCQLVHQQPLRPLSDTRTAWNNYDSCLHSLSDNLNVKGHAKWDVIARECGASLWLWVPHVVEEAGEKEEVGEEEEEVGVACDILALSAPLVDVPHSMAEISLHR